MRKSIILALLLSIAMGIHAAPVSLQKALEAARTFMSVRNAKAQFTAAEARSITSRAPQAQPSFYIFNADDNEGFVVVSADDRTPLILGYSTSGTLNIDNAPDNVRAWLEGYNEQISQLDEPGINAPAPQRVKTSTRNAITPLVAAQWDQASPYWDQCPTFMTDDGAEQAYTGCVATAMAQIMNVYKWPETTPQEIPSYTFTYSMGDYNYGTQEMPALPVTSFDWAHILNTYTGSEDSVYTSAVAKLMFYAGCAVKMQYGISSSGAYTDDIPKALALLGYNADSIKIKFRNDYDQQEWDDMVYNELAKNRPLIYNGTAGSGGGHSFVCDGYDYGDYFHINWGWGGMANGYFLLSVLNPHESGIGGAASGEGYNMKQNVILGIVPGTASGTQPVENEALTATSLYFNYNESSMTMERDSKSQPFRLYKRKYINVSYSDHTGTGKRYKEGIALYNEQGDSLIEIITTSVVYSTVTTSAAGDLSQFGKDVSDSRSGYAFGKNLTGTYRIVPVCQVEGSEEWKPMLATDRYYAAVDITSTTATLTAHPVSNMRVDSFSFVGDAMVGSGEQVLATITNEGPDRFFGNLFLWVDGEQIDEFGGYTTTIQAEIASGETRTVTFNFTPTAAGTKQVGISLDDQGSKPLSGTGSITVSAFEEKPLNLSVNIVAENADEENNIYDNIAHFRADITNNGEGTYNKYVLAPLFIATKDSAGQITGGKMVTYRQNNLQIAPGETKSVYFDFENLGFGSTYALNIYARNEAGTLVNIVKSGESRFYDICRGMVVWTTEGTRYGVKPAESLSAPDNAVAVSLEGVTFNEFTPSANKNCLYLIGEEADVPAGMQGLNIVKGSDAENITLLDGYSFFTPVTFTAQNISYKRMPERTLTDGTHGWTTIVLPFKPETMTLADGTALTFCENATDEKGNIFLCNYTAQDDRNLYFSYATELEANMPYIIGFKHNLTDTVCFQAANATIMPGAKPTTSGPGYLLTGEWMQAEKDSLFVLSGESGLFEYTNHVAVEPFRVYAHAIADGADGSLNIIIEGGSPTTGITSVSAKEADLKQMYNLQGQRVGAAYRGIVVVDGKKQIRR